ncbi:MAG TPA: stage 0 sporulation family protein [Anaerovoracaceae bacterium]|nr:stage 0 sporulation family protein [Eubacteriales bacterium]HPF19500.1 stage 0 sporulation family protein [Bacillota bacterium]HRV33377.1 stage 0 sporulation family protein [Anaerovoracaceae bacterium]
MAKVAGIRFKEAGKIYYFNPGELELSAGDDVIVETARGIEYGSVAYGTRNVEETEIVAPLKPVLRRANEADRAHHEENQQKRTEALALCQEKIDKHGLDMKLVDVEYTFDNSKVIFYFTAEGRVDFRELVKDLAGVFRTRIELRQIGVRDETKMMGGIGSCGRALCCYSWLPDFEPVSIKMAKTQNLSLNPVKISGICGRLMCCLQFENAVYTELKKGMPEHGDRVRTRDGEVVVFDVNILENKIKTRLVLEAKTEERPEKLSTEYYIYGKEEIDRTGQPSQGAGGDRGKPRKKNRNRNRTERQGEDAQKRSGSTGSASGKRRRSPQRRED